MKYVSTRDNSKEYSFEEVFIKGLADDGGLYVPTSLKKFNSDELDQTDKLFSCLKARKEDNSKGVMLKGTHTIIASAGLRENFLGDWADDEFKRNTIKKISNLIDESD